MHDRPRSPELDETSRFDESSATSRFRASRSFSNVSRRQERGEETFIAACQGSSGENQLLPVSFDER